MVKQILCQRRAFIFVLLSAYLSILILSIFFGFATYLHTCDLGYMVFLHSSRLYHVDFSKKEIESAAGLNSLVILFLIVLSLRRVYPVVILTQLLCAFAAYLYIGMLLQYLFMPVGWYFYDYGLISAVPTLGLNCCDFWAQFFSRLKQTFISMLRSCFC